MKQCNSRLRLYTFLFLFKLEKMIPFVYFNVDQNHNFENRSKDSHLCTMRQQNKGDSHMTMDQDDVSGTQKVLAPTVYRIVRHFPVNIIHVLNEKIVLSLHRV
jgi:hypothetical protein